jgi:hypothetical protein
MVSPRQHTVCLALNDFFTKRMELVDILQEMAKDELHTLFGIKLVANG